MKFSAILSGLAVSAFQLAHAAPVEANLEARSGSCHVTLINDNNRLQSTIPMGDTQYTWNAVGWCQVIVDRNSKSCSGWKFTPLPNCDYMDFPITFDAQPKP
ncbi:hypothetical protein E4U35_005961 [Claviceps purpurea]|uniref:Uncharacterized protein n=1 Tax=Claviceps purpurea (strain 20.1) TaxID=1111077 RepID=M1W0Z0_CLAP2|nr:hypothetical protein E4U38_001096 [Claviceps purpurea]CCE30286.1 uncharacterized protein CPUR_04134 [Claviceps purpurea 20.1]KAG6153590.1 hypothetical protein E4U37_002772 [Claviceps purpurea]KAG6160275.1 hypothetical protein E4U11_004012 [Claviceps purpurea]KAG6170487.1 hypothetical protein E4U51_000820 [Claviceps purpurea]